jgi:hypothetical protein
VSEYEIPKPGFGRLAREPDRGRFLSGALRPINAILRRMYGIQVTRVRKRAGGEAYFLDRSATGKLFVFADEPEADDTPGGPRPHIASNLRLAPAAPLNHIDVFVDGVFFSRAERAPDAEDSPTPKDNDNSEEGLDKFLADKFAKIAERDL